MDSTKKRGLFFDLDHSVIRPKSGAMFPMDADDWEFVPGVVEAIRPFIEAEYIFCIISNQGGIEKGYHTAEEIEIKLNNVLDALAKQLKLSPPHGRYTWFYCGSFAEHPDRKPNPGMILHAIDKLNIDPQLSLFVGDMDTDRQAASAGGIRDYMHIDHFIHSKPQPPLVLYE